MRTNFSQQAEIFYFTVSLSSPHASPSKAHELFLRDRVNFLVWTRAQTRVRESASPRATVPLLQTMGGGGSHAGRAAADSDQVDGEMTRAAGEMPEAGMGARRVRVRDVDESHAGDEGGYGITERTHKRPRSGPWLKGHAGCSEDKDVSII